MPKTKYSLAERLLIAIALGTASPLGAQAPNPAAYDVVRDSLVARFNRNDLAGIYAMGDSSFRAGVTEQQIVSLFTGARAMGQIMRTEQVGDTPEGRYYRLVFASRSLLLSFIAKSPLTYDNLGLSFYRLPPDRTRGTFLSDNQLVTPLDSTVQTAVTRFMSNRHVSGLSIGVIRDGVIRTWHYGEVRKETGVLPTDDTIYEIGSITKTFTGILLAGAVLDGRIKLNDDIRKYLDGKFPNLERGGRPILIRHLSNHTSGLPSQPRIEGSGEDPFSPKVTVTWPMVNDILHRVTLDTMPGTRRVYSNFAVGLLGMMLEKVYGKSLEQLFAERIFRPYGMTRSGIGLAEASLVGAATGYDLEGTPTKPSRNRLAEPAGGIQSTTSDMLRYVQAQFDSTNRAATLSHRLTFGDVRTGTGLGWGIVTTKEGNHLRWSHDGGTDGFTSLLLIYPELRAGIVLLTNFGDHSDDSFFRIGRTIYTSWLAPPP